MKIEGDYLIFSSGKKVYTAEGIVALDNDGDILIDNDRNSLAIPELSEQEKYELSRYMIERWIDVRDKLWARHEEAMRAEPLETQIPLPLEKMDGPPFKYGPPFRCRCMAEPYITREHTADLVLTSENITASNKEERVEGVGIEGGTKADLRWSEAAAKQLLREVHPCPQCTTSTIIGLAEEGPDLWRVVEARYCPVCGWREGQEEMTIETQVRGRKVKGVVTGEEDKG